LVSGSDGWLSDELDGGSAIIDGPASRYRFVLIGSDAEGWCLMNLPVLGSRGAIANKFAAGMQLLRNDEMMLCCF